jgi:hypothetical protein
VGVLQIDGGHRARGQTAPLANLDEYAIGKHGDDHATTDAASSIISHGEIVTIFSLARCQIALALSANLFLFVAVSCHLRAHLLIA